MSLFMICNFRCLINCVTEDRTHVLTQIQNTYVLTVFSAVPYLLPHNGKPNFSNLS